MTTLTITKPTYNQAVKGTVNIEFTFNEPALATRSYVQIDDKPAIEVNTYSPGVVTESESFPIDTTKIPNGEHRLSCNVQSGNDGTGYNSFGRTILIKVSN